MKFGQRSGEPPPEWLGTIQSARLMHCQPWVVDDDPTITPYEWSQRALAVSNAEHEAQEWHSKKKPRGR